MINNPLRYEEGVWTPSIGGSGGQSGQVHVNQESRYVRTGNHVWVSCYVSLSTRGTITGSVQIAGLPFVCENGVLQFYLGSLSWGNLANNYVSMACYVPQNTSILGIIGLTAASVSGFGSSLVQADLNNNSYFVATANYMTP